jgi:DNA modification methylase
MSAKKNNGSTRLSHMFDDDYSDSEWNEFLIAMSSCYWIATQDSCAVYMSLDWRRSHELIPKMKDSGFKFSNLIVWDKMVHGLGSDYKYTHEFIHVFKKGKPIIDSHQGDGEYKDIWHIQRKMCKDEEHATKKPIELCERGINHASKPKNIVLDLFGGSGSTLIAAEKTNRYARLMELDPIYCAVILDRWEKYTNRKAIREDGKLWDDIKEGK